MSYNEHTWQTGETITAEKLNNLEQGVTDASSDFVEYTYSGGGKYYLRKSGNIVEVILDNIYSDSNKYSDIKLPFPSGFEPSPSQQIYSALTVIEYSNGQGQVKPKVTNLARNGEDTFGIADYATGTFTSVYVFGYGAYKLA